MIDTDDLYLDRTQLTARGWTRTLIARFLPRPGRWATVSHWRNYTGKATYFVERVIAAEQLADFERAFAASVVRRNLPQVQVAAAMAERARVDVMYRQWLNTVTSEEVQRMLLAEEMAACLESARAMGYRTPHK